MPLLLLKDEPEFKLGVWKIEEQMSFFADQIPFQSNIAHSGRKRQQMATRYLLNIMQEGFPFDEIKNNDAGKPFVQGNSFQFNLSHTNDLAAAIISSNKSVGIDAEKINSRVLKIQHKFLNEVEAVALESTNEEEKVLVLTKYWTIKEAVYKWWGVGGVDFANDIRIVTNRLDDRLVNVRFEKETGIQLDINCFQLDGHWISYVVK